MKDLHFLLKETEIRTLDAIREIHKATFAYDKIPDENIGPIENVLAALSERAEEDNVDADVNAD